MRIRYGLETEAMVLADDDCPTTQCGFCEQWMCDCQARVTPCARHFDDPCLREGEQP